MYDKAVAGGMLPVTGAGMVMNSLTVVLVGMALLGASFALMRIAPRFSRK